MSYATCRRLPPAGYAPQRSAALAAGLLHSLPAPAVRAGQPLCCGVLCTLCRSTQVPDDGDEVDRKDEAICPTGGEGSPFAFSHLIMFFSYHSFPLK